MNIFNQDNPFNEFMSRIGDLAMLNIAWIICCIPIVTIGASTTAMFEVVRSLHEGHDAHVIQQFRKALTRRFGISLVLEFIAAVFIGLAMFNLWYLTKQVSNVDLASVSYGITIAVTLIILAGVGFVFPLASRSKLGVGAQIKQSLGVAAAHPLTALEILILNAAPIAIAIFVPGGLSFVVFFWGLLFTACSAWVIVYLMLKAGIITVSQDSEE